MEKLEMDKKILLEPYTQREYMDFVAEANSYGLRIVSVLDEDNEQIGIEAVEQLNQDNTIISPRQMEVYLIREFDIDHDYIADVINSLPVGMRERKIALAEFNRAIEIHRENPLIGILAQKLKDEGHSVDVSKMFNEAKNI